MKNEKYAFLALYLNALILGGIYIVALFEIQLPVKITPTIIASKFLLIFVFMYTYTTGTFISIKLFKSKKLWSKKFVFSQLTIINLIYLTLAFRAYIIQSMMLFDLTPRPTPSIDDQTIGFLEIMFCLGFFIAHISNIVMIKIIIKMNKVSITADNHVIS